jgi:bifunctional N-acetylglucosamine-1-phosphate-uridyltransferase/glucosamine-1-phosphate-acetyltransferase GlmU-like protein
MRIDKTATIADTARLEAPSRPLYTEQRQPSARGETEVGANCWIGHQCVVGQGATIGSETTLDTAVVVDNDATIGARVLVTHRAHIAAEAVIADECVIGGYICERARIGVRCRIFGDLVHKQLNPRLPWDEPEAQEPSPIVADHAFIGWGAIIIGAVEVGRGAYVAAGATITRDVPSGHIATRVNEVTTPDEWRGPLATGAFERYGNGHARSAE